MPHSSESDSDAPEAISLKTAKKFSVAQDRLVQDRNAQVAKRAKDKNRARDARLKAAKGATNRNRNSRAIESNPSEEQNGGKKRNRALRKPVDVLPPPPKGDCESEDRMIDVEPNGAEEEDEDEDPTQTRIRMRMEAAMHDVEGEGASPDPDGLSDSDAEGLDGDFAFGAGEGEDDSIADGEAELETSGEDEEMKNPGAEDEDEDGGDAEWTGSGGISVGVGGPGRDSLPARKRKRGEEALPLGSRAALGNPDYLPDELFAQAAAAVTARVVPKPTGSKAKEVKRKKRNQKRTKSKDLVIGSRTVQVIRPLNPAAMASYTVPSKPAQQFVKQRLKGGLAAKGWERRPVNIGSLSVRGGPAKGFRRT